MTVSEFNSCVDKYADGLYRFILKNLKDPSRSSDIVQDTFEKVWMKVSEVESSNAKSYMYTTAYRTMIDQIRKDAKYSGQDVPEVMIHSHAVNNELKEVLDHALTKLPEIQKVVVLLRDYEGYSYEEIGEITGLSASQVKVYIYRARIALKDHLLKEERMFSA